MRWSRFAVFICVVAILQASLLDVVAVTRLNIKPDLLLVLLVFFAVSCDTTEAVVTSFSIGFAADIISPTVGPQIISFGLFGTLLAHLHGIIAIRKMPYQSLVIFVTGLLTGVLAHFLALLKDQPSESGVYTVIFGTSLYSGFIGPFLFPSLVWWMRIKIHRFGRR